VGLEPSDCFVGSNSEVCPPAPVQDEQLATGDETQQSADHYWILELVVAVDGEGGRIALASELLQEIKVVKAVGYS